MPAGAPKGNTNAARGFKATQALEKAVYRLSSGDNTPCGDYEEVLVQVWVKAIEKAKDTGDIPALNAIMDRLEGKPKQSMDIIAEASLTIIQKQYSPKTEPEPKP